MLTDGMEIESLLQKALTLALAYLVLFGADWPLPFSVTGPYLLALFIGVLVFPSLAKDFPGRATEILVAGNTALIVVGLILAGYASYDLAAACLVAMMVAVFGDSERRLAAAAMTVAGIYFLWNLREVGVLSAVLWIRMPFLVVTTLFFGFMIDRARRDRNARVAAETDLRNFRALVSITQGIASKPAAEGTLDHVAACIRSGLGLERCGIHFVRRSSPLATAPGAIEALRARGPVVEPTNDGRFVLAVPVLYHAEMQAVLFAELPGGRQPTDAEIATCQIVANAMAPAIKNVEYAERIADVERNRSELLANLSYEIRTPLNAILGFSELAGDLSSGSLQELAERINDNAKQLHFHIENLLTPADATAEREHAEIARVDVRQLVNGAVSRARRIAGKKPIELHVDVEPSVTDIYTDGRKLERIVESFLLNAVKLSDHGAVELRARVVESTANGINGKSGLELEQILKVSVHDTAEGLRPEKLSRIVGGVGQTDESGTRRHGGIGIGLALARRLAETLGGTIRVQSSEGFGSEFEVLLPVHAAAERMPLALAQAA